MTRSPIEQSWTAKKGSFTELSICRLDFPPTMGSLSMKMLFDRFFLRLSRIRCSQAISIGKCRPTASSNRYDFSAENSLLRGSGLGPKIITNIGCSGAIFYHRHDLGALDPATKSDDFLEKIQMAFDPHPPLIFGKLCCKLFLIVMVAYMQGEMMAR